MKGITKAPELTSINNQNIKKKHNDCDYFCLAQFPYAHI